MDWSVALTRLREVGEHTVASAPSFALGLVVLVLFYAAGRAVRTAVHRGSLRRRRRNLALVMGRLVQGGIVLAGLLIAAVIAFPNFTMTRAIEFLGIGSVALGFAFRDVLQNYLAGILILLTEPFRIGDQIVFADFEGTVEDVQTRATLLRTYDGRRVVIPNAELFTNSVTVNTAFDRRRLQYDVGIGYGDDVERARRVVLETLGELEEVLAEPPPEVLVYDLAPSAVNLRVRWWVQPPRISDALDSRDRVLAALKHRLQRHGIDLPFPTQQVLFHDQTEETDGQRSRQREGWPAGGAGEPRPDRIAGAIERVNAGPDGRDGGR